MAHMVHHLIKIVYILVKINILQLISNVLLNVPLQGKYKSASMCMYTFENCVH